MSQETETEENNQQASIMKMSLKLLTVLFNSLLYQSTVNGSSLVDVDIRNSLDKVPTPIVLWHGMGDTCCAPYSLGHFKQMLQREIPSVYVSSLSFGGSTKADFSSGYFGLVNDQVSHACELIQNDEKLKQGFHAIGFSQGGQFLRAVAQRCPNKMKTLITLGGQHQGVCGLPHCDNKVCQAAGKLLSRGAYNHWVQSHIVQAQYWHSLNEQEYRNHSLFLADINNEREVNKIYKENLVKLANLVLIQFENDTMVYPKESSSFGWFTEGNASDVVDFRDTRLYQDNRIGLRDLDSSGRLFIYKVPGDHLQIDMSWFTKEIIRKFLKH